MEIIESLSHAAFADYVAETRNTICGRHPIGVLLAALESLPPGDGGFPSSSAGVTTRQQQQQQTQLRGVGRPRHGIRFVQYAQSSRVVGPGDSSVSYASAVVFRLL
jgi:predicted class III extradiol MEMO1 family dioxygenase